MLLATTPCTFSTAQLPKVLQEWYAFTILTSKCAPATTMSTFSTSQLPKALQISQFFTVLTSKCASCHNGVHFFNSATSESAPRMVCLYLFDFQMRFLPQRCQLFRHLNFQNCSEPDSFFLPSFDFEMCFAPQWRAIVYLSCGQMAPHPPL